MLPFSKYSACGNDFILFDNRLNIFPFHHRSLISHLCHRKWGIGADGIILMENSSQADYLMRIFNSDGSEAEMCGNGLCCFIKWLYENGFQQEKYQIEVHSRILTAIILANGVNIQMGDPTNIQWDIPFRYKKQSIHLHHINTGVPHTIYFANNIHLIDLNDIGSYIRSHPLWKPKGTNVTIAEKIHVNRLKIRTYERGVEGETGACGTGAAAAALAAAYYFHLSGPIFITPSSKEELIIEFLFQNQVFSQVTLTSSPRLSFSGEIKIRPLA